MPIAIGIVLPCRQAGKPARTKSPKPLVVTTYETYRILIPYSNKLHS